MNEIVINHISKEFLRIKTKNPAYSMRSMARRLGVQPSALSEILNRKRSVTKKMARTILNGIGMSPREIEKIILAHELEKKDAKRDLSLDYFNVISEWQYFAIMSLAKLDNFQSDYKWISDRLNITEMQAKKSIKTLLRLGLLEKDQEDKIKTTGKSFSTPSDIKSASLKNHSLESLDMAADSLNKDPVHLRDITEMTMAIDVTKLPAAKKMIEKFQDKLANFLEKDNKNAVYKIGVQLYPLSTIEETELEKLEK